MDLLRCEAEKGVCRSFLRMRRELYPILVIFVTKDRWLKSFVGSFLIFEVMLLSSFKQLRIKIDWVEKKVMNKKKTSETFNILLKIL